MAQPHTIRIRLVADRAYWNLQVNGRFNTFKSNANVSARHVASLARNEAQEIVDGGLVRPKNASRRGGGRGLAEAYRQSILSYSVGRGGFGVGVRIVDEQTLTRAAVYWRAQEEGSSHLVGSHVRLIGFGYRRGGQFLRQVGDKGNPGGSPSGTHPDAQASASRGAVIRNPIRPKKHLQTISHRAAARFEARIKRDLDRSFSP